MQWTPMQWNEAGETTGRLYQMGRTYDHLEVTLPINDPYHYLARLAPSNNLDGIAGPDWADNDGALVGGAVGRRGQTPPLAW